MDRKKIAVMWKAGPVFGEVNVSHGAVPELDIVDGQGRVDGHTFTIMSSGPCRLVVTCPQAAVGPGACATRITVNADRNPFTFFLRDVRRAEPVFIPAYGVIVTEFEETDDYETLAARIRGRGRVSQLEAIDAADEETFENACRVNRNLQCPTWLGLGRDMRMFEVHYYPEYGCWGYVQPCFGRPQGVPETGNRVYRLVYTIGPGVSCRMNITRQLEEKILPILRSVQVEDDVQYEVTQFATLENRPIDREAVHGSDWRACYANAGGCNFAPEEKNALKDLLDREMHGREEETVCCIRVVATNRGKAPRYAWFRGMIVKIQNGDRQDDEYDSRLGAGRFPSGRVFAVHRLNGEPAPNHELAILLQPGERATYEILVPHEPLPEARAEALLGLNIETHLEACRSFWRKKLAKTGSVSVPEAAVDERIQAGLLHCDLVTLGKSAAGPLLATLGVYGPIGSESAPIIQFFDSMGLHEVARRCIDFFLAHQRDDGFMQNYGRYELETGPVLWTMGEHYRYTRDDDWLQRVKPNVLKACEYLLAWRDRNKKPELRGKGYGLLDGRVADPEDFFHSFMLNALSCVGLRRAAEMLAAVDSGKSAELAAEAEAFRQDIRAAYEEAVARSPAIPLDDGTWVPSVPPWAEYPGPVALYADGGNWFTHGAFGARDSLIGALYLVIGEVLEPDELGTDFLLKCHQQLFTVRNAGLSQPYYCRHDFIHLKRGEVKAYLKTYYNQFTALQDRETYTFWEHYQGAGRHKTHEEGWFLMQTRWMLWMEEGQTLNLLPCIPRRWMEDGNRIQLKGVATYFGPLDLDVRSRVAEGRIEADIRCPGSRSPRSVRLRLPHPSGEKAVALDGAEYDSDTESAVIQNFGGMVKIRLHFVNK